MLQFKIYTSLILIILSFFTLNADGLGLTENLSQSKESITTELANKNKESKKSLTKRKPSFSYTQSFQGKKNLFFQTNIGVGFLYFSGIRGNLMGKPVINFDPTNYWRDVPFKGRLSYNRTPLFEYLIGYRINNSIKFALSYQHQAGITIQSKALSTYPNGASTNKSEMAQFISNLSLDALLAKVYFELPYSLIFKNLATSPYLALGLSGINSISVYIIALNACPALPSRSNT